MAEETYPFQTTYLQSYQTETEPGSLVFAALCRHKRAPKLVGTRYLELGCGHGISLAAHAACHPEMDFVGIDILVDHVTGARALADEADLSNVTVMPGDIAALAREAPPGGPFDIVVLHGVWSWVGAATRRAIVKLLRRWVAPGGLVYISYNARPFWNVVEPLRFILREVMGPSPDKARIDAAREAVDAWLEHAGDGPQTEFWSRVKRLPNTYLVHEFGAPEAAAFWPQEVAKTLAPLQIAPVGQLPLVANYPQLRMDEGAEALLTLGESMGFAETAADLAHARSFRSDLFAHGAPRLPDAGVTRALTGWTLVPTPPPDEGVTRRTLPGLDEALQSLPPGTAIPDAVAALSSGDRNGLQGVVLAVMLDHLAPVAPGRGAAEAGMRRFNALARRTAQEGPPLPCAICLRLGRPVLLTRSEARHVFLGDEIDAEAAARLASFDFGE